MHWVVATRSADSIFAVTSSGTGVPNKVVIHTHTICIAKEAVNRIWHKFWKTNKNILLSFSVSILTLAPLDDVFLFTTWLKPPLQHQIKALLTSPHHCNWAHWRHKAVRADFTVKGLSHRFLFLRRSRHLVAIMPKSSYTVTGPAGLLQCHKKQINAA